MPKVQVVSGIENLPVYVVADEDPREVFEEQFLSDGALPELLASMAEGQRLYLVNYASAPARTRLTRLL